MTRHKKQQPVLKLEAEQEELIQEQVRWQRFLDSLGKVKRRRPRHRGK